MGFGAGIGTVVDSSGNHRRSRACQNFLNQSVVRVEADRLLDSKLLFNDPSFPQQWGLANSGANGAIAGADIHAEPALARFQGTGGTLVAIIDTGVDYTHPELSSRMWINPSEIAGNGIDDDKNGFVDDVFGANFVNGTGNPMDDNGHGTHIAGIIAATANNEIGVTGVNPNARIMALKFLDSQGFGDLTGAISALITPFPREQGSRTILGVAPDSAQPFPMPWTGREARDIWSLPPRVMIR